MCFSRLHYIKWRIILYIFLFFVQQLFYTNNANTPNYKRLTVSFEDKLKKAMEKEENKLVRTHPKHFPISQNINDIKPEIIVDRNFSYRFDGNNVNIDTESANLAKNTIMYNALVSQTIDEFDKIKNVINEGSKY